MTTAPYRKNAFLRAAAFFVFSTLIGVAFASQLYLFSSKAGLQVSWSQAISSSLADWYLFALLALPAIWLTRHFQFAKGQWRSVAILHIIAALLFSFCWVLLRSWLVQLQAGWSGQTVVFQEVFSGLLGKTFRYNLWVYFMIVAVTHAFDYYQKFHERELRTQELETRLTRAKLQALQMQLNPHFLFNTLHTISALMHKDVEAADRMVMKLSELLRLALDNTDTHEVPLQEELEFLQRYLEIEKTRFRDRLNIVMEVAPDTLRAKVPNLVLQPLVENAIRHGIEKHARPGKITLRAEKKDGQLELQVQDNGGGLKSNAQHREGIGLSNTRMRLQQLYGEEQAFELKNVETGGLLARVVIPFHLAEQTSQREEAV